MDSWGRVLPGRRGVAAIGLALFVVFATGVAAGVAGQPNISVFAPENTLTPGETTQIELQVMNSGTITESESGLDAIVGQGNAQQVQTARNVTLDAEADGPPFDVETGTVPLGALQDGTVRSVPITLSVNDDADPGTYLLSVTIDYVYTAEINGSERTTVEETTTEEVSVEIEESADFAVESVSSTLEVGESGEITGEIENTGSETASGATLQLTNQYGTITVPERTYPLGELAPGESASFNYDADVSGGANAGERPANFVIQYRDEGGVQANASVDTQISVAEETEDFSVESDNATVESGGSQVIALNVTNERDEPVTNLNAQLFAESPLSVTNGEAYAGELGPGETTTLSFEMSAESGAVAQPYPLEIDFSYEDTDGNTRLSDRYQVPVEVTESSDGGLLSNRLVIGAALVVIVVGLVLVGRQYLR